jgi:hypothetical protein
MQAYNSLGVDVGGILVVQHVIGERNLALLVGDDGERELAARNLVNVLDPSSVALDSVCRETNQLNTAFGELGLQLGKGAELGGADGSVVLRVGEEHNPAVADELVEVNGAVGGFGLEIGCLKRKVSLRSMQPIFLGHFIPIVPRRRGGARGSEAAIFAFSNFSWAECWELVGRLLGVSRLS